MTTTTIKFCINCGQPEGKHSTVGNNCPYGNWYSDTETFSTIEAEMLAALEMVSRSLEDIALGRGGWDWEAILSDVQVAIQKAKGGQ